MDYCAWMRSAYMCVYCLVVISVVFRHPIVINFKAAFCILQILEITAEEIMEVESSTRLQSKSPLWKEERLKRITASNFGEICMGTDRQDKQKLAQRLVLPSSAYGPAIDHGIKYESAAISWFEEEQKTQTSPAGLFISAECPFLAASPDRIINDYQLLEVKCPYTARNLSISPTTVPYLEISVKELSLKKNHKYYYQVQGQLFCSGKSECLFLVFTFKDKKVIKVSRDDQFISEMKDKLVFFFINYFREAYLQKNFFKHYDQFRFCY